MVTLGRLLTPGSLQMHHGLETLEGRVLFAATQLVTIGGTKYKTFAEENGFQILVPNKPQLNKVLSNGTSGNFARNVTNPKALSSLMVAAESAAETSGFQITLSLGGSGVTTAVQTAFNNAIAKWQSIITADVPDVN